MVIELHWAARYRYRSRHGVRVLQLSQLRRQSSVTEGRKQFLEGTKFFSFEFEKLDQKPKFLMGKYARISTNTRMRTKKEKKGLYSETCKNVHEFKSEDQKKGFYRKICEKTVFAREVWGDD